MEHPMYVCEGLPTGDVLISDIRDEVSEATVCQYFGPKSSKSGWRYCSHTTEEEQIAILNLYRKVYDADEPPNKEISLSFAKGLILMSMGRSVNWFQFAVERKKVREALKKKSEDRKVKREKEKDGSEDQVSVPSVIGKKRCVAGKEDLGFPRSLTLSVKSEGVVEGASSTGKKSGVKLGVSVLGPCWNKEEVESMVKAIECHTDLIGGLKIALVESSKALSALEDKLRREKLLSSDRELMLNEVQLCLSNIDKEVLPLQESIDAKKILLVQLGQGSCDTTSREEHVAVVKDIAALSAQMDALSFKRASDEVTARFCRASIAECRNKIVELESALQESSASNGVKNSRILSLEAIMLSMQEQLHRMQNGSGASFYPRPLERSPEKPIVETHSINACPVCSLWFDCFDYFSLACGHTYHPYCLYEHAQKSSQCLLSSCCKPFTARNVAGLGLRPAATWLNMQKKVEFKESIDCSKKMLKESDVQTKSATTGATSDSSELLTKKEISLEKVTPLSQSNETDGISEPPTPVPVKWKSANSMCRLCQKKEVSVIIKACGHDVFCFGCVQGLVLCPICGGVIKGWSRINTEPKLSSFLKLPHTNLVHSPTEPQVPDMMIVP